MEWAVFRTFRQRDATPAPTSTCSWVDRRYRGMYRRWHLGPACGHFPRRGRRSDHRLQRVQRGFPTRNTSPPTSEAQVMLLEVTSTRLPLVRALERSTVQALATQTSPLQTGQSWRICTDPQRVPGAHEIRLRNQSHEGTSTPTCRLIPPEPSPLRRSSLGCPETWVIDVCVCV
jgi:hypothetical protein